MYLKEAQPRDADTATSTGAVLCFVGGGMSGGFTVLSDQASSTAYFVAIMISSLMLMTFGVLLLTLPPRLKAGIWLPLPLFGVAAILLANIGTRDASAAGQVFLCLPVLYAASQLRAPAAWLTAVAALAADAVVAFSLLPLAAAVPDVVFVGSTIAVSTYLLVRAGDRNDALVTRLTEQAAIDPLTGLVTRRVLDDTALSALASSDGGPGTALVVLDLDRFKSINDSYGHPGGDAALAHVAAVLRNRCRPDTVISRLGGDELAVLLPGCPDDVAHKRAAELVAAVGSEPLVLPSGESVPLSISAGVAHAPTQAADLRELYVVADEALYDAKRNGRGRVGTSSPRSAAAASA